MTFRIAVHSLLWSLFLVFTTSVGVLAADAVVPGIGPEQLPLLVAGGTTGLIAGMTIMLWLFITGKVKPGAASDEWKAVAVTQTDTVSKLVPSVEKLVASVDRLLAAVELMNTEARLRREFEQEQRKAGGG